MGLYITHRKLSLVKRSNSMPFLFKIVKKSPGKKNVQTHIFEILHHWMVLDVKTFDTGGVSNKMADYTVLM